MISTLASSALRGFTVLFVAALTAETAVRLWLVLAPDRGGACASRPRARALLGPDRARGAAARCRLHRGPRPSEPLGDGVRGADQARAHAGRRARGDTNARRPCALARALAGHAAGALRAVASAARGLAVRPVAHVSYRGAVRVQQDHAAPVRARFAQAIGAGIRDRRAPGACDARIDGSGGRVVVAVGVARLARRQSRARVGCPALHRAAVQSVLAARPTRRCASAWKRCSSAAASRPEAGCS